MDGQGSDVDEYEAAVKTRSRNKKNKKRGGAAVPPDVNVGVGVGVRDVGEAETPSVSRSCTATERYSKLEQWSVLPPGLMTIIFDYLRPSDVTSVSSVCRNWRIFVYTHPPYSWRRVICIVGGYSETVLHTADVYSPVANLWTHSRELYLNLNRMSFGLTATENGDIYIAGGETPGVTRKGRAKGSTADQPSCDTLVHHPGTAGWFPTGKLTAERAYCSACTLNDTIFICGGSTTGKSYLSGISGVVEAHVCRSKVWSQSGALATPRTHHCAVATPAGIFIFGGHSLKGKLLQCEVLQVEGNRVVSAGSFPAPAEFMNSSCTLLGDFIYISGGEQPENPRQSVCNFYCCNINTREWEELPPMLHPRHSHCSVTCMDCIYVIGGENSSTVEKYDPAARKWTTCAGLNYPRSFFGAWVGDAQHIHPTLLGAIVPSSTIRVLSTPGPQRATGRPTQRRPRKRP